MTTAWVVEWNKALRDLHGIFFDPTTKSIRHEYAEFRPCPVCSSRNESLYCVKDGFRYVRCNDCTMVFLNPRLNNEATHRFYNSRANEIYNKAKFDTESASRDRDDKANLDNLDWIEGHRASRGGDLLEIGSAKGYFLEKARQRGFRVHGLELNETNWRRSRELLGGTMLNVDLESAHYPSESFDVIYMRDVIAHLPDPKAFLRECWRIARPGAVFFVDTHNIDSFINRMTKGAHTVIFGFMEPHHWSPKTLRRVFEDSGFRLKEIRFESIDATVSEVLGYRAYPSFTTIFPARNGKLRGGILRRLHALISRRPFSWIDHRVTPAIAKALRQGSVMRVLAEKPPKKNG
jgi:2-polyprenyl-3-methyl-5-hydroxy-6-metoxy-1,4-benzoquinol methylase